MVNVTRFSVFGTDTCDVLHAGKLSEFFEFFTATVVKNVNLNFVGRPVNVAGGQHRGAHNFQGFVVGGNVYIHRWPQGKIIRQRGGPAL